MNSSASTKWPRESKLSFRSKGSLKYPRLQPKTGVCSVQWGRPCLDGRVRHVERGEEPESEAQKPETEVVAEGLLREFRLQQVSS